MRLAILMPLALAGCGEPLWQVSGDTATGRADIKDSPYMDTLRQTERLLEEAPAASRLTIDYYGAAPDRLGNETRVIFYTAHFDGSEIAKANFANLDMWEVAKLATAVTRGDSAGTRVLSQECPFSEAVCAAALKPPAPQ